jgi:hypothetical protein
MHSVIIVLIILIIGMLIPASYMMGIVRGVTLEREKNIKLPADVVFGSQPQVIGVFY